jgi:hypothetical protein
MAQTSRTVEAYVHYRRRSGPLLVAAIRQVGRVINQSSSLSSCRAWALNRISSSITDAIVMALRHERGRRDDFQPRPPLRSDPAGTQHHPGMDSGRVPESGRRPQRPPYPKAEGAKLSPGEHR